MFDTGFTLEDSTICKETYKPEGIGFLQSIKVAWRKNTYSKREKIALVNGSKTTAFHEATDQSGALHLEMPTQSGKGPAPDCAPWLNSSQFLQQTQRLPVLYLLSLCESKLLTNLFSKTSHLAPLSILNALSPKNRNLLTTLWLRLNWKLQK